MLMGFGNCLALGLEAELLAVSSLPTSVYIRA